MGMFAQIRVDQQKNKDLGVESLRGIAILLVVAFHIIGYSPSTGLHVAEDSFWKYFTYTFEFIRLPLFVAISGYVYAIKPVQKSDGSTFLLGKARRIMLPFLTVSTLQFIVNTYAPNTNNNYDIADIWRIYLFPWAQFWYLQAMAIVFVIIYLLERSSILRKFLSWLMILAGSTVILMLLNKYHHSGFFSFWGVVYIFPFFLLGLGIKRFSDRLFEKKTIYLALFILLGGLTLQQLRWFELINYKAGRMSLITILMSMSAIFILFRTRRHYPSLAWLGFYSYSIYLFHVFGGSGSRILLTWIGIENKLILFIGCMLAAVILPVMIERIVLPLRWPRFLLLGLRLKKCNQELLIFRTAHPQEAKVILHNE